MQKNIEGGISMDSFIRPDQTWVLWGFITGWAAFSIYLEGKYEWAKKVTGAIIALLGALVLSNLNIIPTDAPAYDAVWTYVIPLSIPMLLFECNIVKIWKESGRLLLLFTIGGIGTVIGAIVGYLILHNYVPGLGKVAAMMTGSYIGGGVNFVALADAFDVPGELVSAATVADNLLMALYFFVLLAVPTIGFFKRHFNHPLEDQINADKLQGIEISADNDYWGRKEMSLRDIAFTFATATIIVAVSNVIANFFGSVIPTSNAFYALLNSLFGNMYLILTTVTMLLATFKSDFFSQIKGAQDIGMFLIYLFMVVIGVPASISTILKQAPLLLVFCGIIVIVNMIITLTATKLLKFNLEEGIIASNANIGGPATAAAMAISKGWTSLIGPSILVSIFGYIIGNYLGIIVGNFLI